MDTRKRETSAGLIRQSRRSRRRSPNPPTYLKTSHLNSRPTGVKFSHSLSMSGSTVSDNNVSKESADRVEGLSLEMEFPAESGLRPVGASVFLRRFLEPIPYLHHHRLEFSHEYVRVKPALPESDHGYVPRRRCLLKLATEQFIQRRAIVPDRGCALTSAVLDGAFESGFLKSKAAIRSTRLAALEDYLAAFSINAATVCGLETMTTWEPPLTTTVCFEWARSAMNARALGGMFLSASP